MPSQSEMFEWTRAQWMSRQLGNSGGNRRPLRRHIYATQHFLSLIHILEGLDLYNVAEIRRPRGGGMEIKFFDRIKALECLERLEAETGQPSLFEALEAGARALKKEESDET